MRAFCGRLVVFVVGEMDPPSWNEADRSRPAGRAHVSDSRAYARPQIRCVAASGRAWGRRRKSLR